MKYIKLVCFLIAIIVSISFFYRESLPPTHQSKLYETGEFRSTSLTNQRIILSNRNQIESKAEGKANESFKENNYIELVEEVEGGDFVRLEEYYSMHLVCSSIKGYDSKDDYLSNYSLSSNLAVDKAEAIYDNCSEVSLKSFTELESLLLKAISAGNKDATYILAMAYPASFKRRHTLLVQSVPFKREAVIAVVDSLDYINHLEASEMLFWSLLKRKFISYDDYELDSRIIDYRKAIGTNELVKVEGFIERWDITATEEDKVKIISDLQCFIEEINCV